MSQAAREKDIKFMDDRPTVFVAHSSLDFDVARVVRNSFEKRQHDTLLLKLAQEMTQDYLENLIQREIQARDWIVVIVSQNSKRSKWVSFEEAYANLRGKSVFYVELEKCSHLTGEGLIECLDRQVASISREIRIFMSYSRQDRAMAQQLADDLQQEGYDVRLEIEQLEPGADWAQSVGDAIEEAAKKGYIIVLLSEHSIYSRFVRVEIKFAMMMRGRIIPCLIEPRPSTVPLMLANIQYLDFTDTPYKQAFQRLIRALR